MLENAGCMGFIILLIFVFCNNSVQCSLNEYAFSAQFIQEFHHKPISQEVSQIFSYNQTIKELVQLIDLSSKGTTNLTEPSLLENIDKIRSKGNEINNENSDIPESFDARKVWPHCPDIGKVYDQGACSSSYAFAVVAAFSDRRCILTKGKHKEPLSIQYLLSCCHTCKYNESTNVCGPGQPITAWWFLHKRGVVTGGSYGSNQGCQPLSIVPCKRRKLIAQTFGCKDGRKPPELQCHTRCTNEGYSVPYTEDKHKAKVQYFVDANVISIQREIMTNGPATAQITLYDDFFHYKSGVYKHISGERHFHMHTAKLIGWGTENGYPYWLLVNSWGKRWGLEGTFKILRGSFECNLEAYVTAAVPKNE